MPEYAIEIESLVGQCWVDETMEGDPGRTCVLKNASRYATANEAHKSMSSIIRKYPNRRYRVQQLNTQIQEQGR